ncbi:MAG: ParB N-terminal domain-containing protein, partial [Cyanobacteriota bacterium]
MTDYHERRRLIRESLKIQPLSHGQVYTYTVGVRSQPQISPQRYEELRWSLENHSSNLIPIVVRRTDSLGGEKEYEAIYGADWVRVAEDLGIETLWAWVFDLSDEEAKATQAELAMLLDHSELDYSNDTDDTTVPK